MRAVHRGNHITDGNASTPENPRNLLLASPVLDQIAQLEEFDEATPARDAFAKTISDKDWLVILLCLAKAMSSFKDCDGLANGLAVNNREGDIVKELREVRPHQRPPEVAMEIFSTWLRCGAEQTTEWRRAELRRVFIIELQRPSLCAFLDDELLNMIEQDGESGHIESRCP